MEKMKEERRKAQILRKNQTKEENHLWYDFLKTYPVQFRRQYPIGPYYADFYCYKANLVVELDGSQHYEPAEARKDQERTEYLQQYGLTVIRIPNNEVMKNFLGVCESIDSFVTQSLSQLR